MKLRCFQKIIQKIGLLKLKKWLINAALKNKEYLSVPKGVNWAWDIEGFVIKFKIKFKQWKKGSIHHLL
jgi:hypothetical protein